MLATGPNYLHVHRSRRSKAEVQPRIIAREKAGLTEHRLRLGLPVVTSHDASAYGAAIRFYAFQLNFNPVGLSREVVSEERRRLIEIDDDNVHITIVIEIAEGAAAATMDRRYSRARFFDQFFKHALSQVSENRARGLIRVLRKFFLDFRVDMTRRHEQVGITVVVQVNNAGAPTNVARLNSEARGCGRVLKVSLSIVAIKNVPVIGKVGFENIEVATEIVITHSNAHARLFLAIVAHGNATQDPLFAKRSVVIVHEEQARSGIASDVDIGPAIFIEIGSYNRHTVTRGSFCDARRLAYVGESSVAIISIEPMSARRQASRPARDRDAQPNAAAVLARDRHALKRKLHVVGNKKI